MISTEECIGGYGTKAQDWHKQLWIADMDGAKGSSDDYFRAGFFSFLTLLSGSLSLACMLLRRVRALSFASIDWSIRWIDGDMNFSALAGWSPVPPVSFSTKEEKGVERPCSRIIRCASTHAVNQSIIPISTNNKSNRTNRHKQHDGRWIVSLFSTLVVIRA